MQPSNYKLIEPIEWAGVKITELKFRAPKGKDLLELKSDPSMGDLLKIASKLSGVEFPAIKELSASDAFAVSEIVGNLLTPSQVIGEKASQ